MLGLNLKGLDLLEIGDLGVPVVVGVVNSANVS
jgi:hypothetical protein